jgi:hypothetical protein
VSEFIDPVFAKTSPKRSFSIIENDRFGHVFAKTGSINSNTGLLNRSTNTGSGYQVCHYCTAARNIAAIEAGLHGCIYRATPDQGQLTHLDVSMHLNTAVLISRTFLYCTCGSEIAWCCTLII